MFIPPVSPYKFDSFGDNGDPSRGEAPESLLKNPSLVEKAKTEAIMIKGFSETFDRDRNGQLDKSEIGRLGQFAGKLANQLGEEVHIGVSRTGDGKLQADITAGDRTAVEAIYPEGTPVFSGHTHLSGNSVPSDADVSSRLDNGTNVVWDSVKGDTSYY